MAHRHERRACARHHRPAPGFSLPSATPQYPPDLELEPRHLDIALRVDIDAKQVAGTVTLTVEPRHPGVRRTLELDAVGFQDVAVASPDGDALTWTYDGEKLRVTWAEAFADQPRRVAVTYRVVDPPGGLIFSSPTAAEPDLPRVCCADNETERARHWLPTIDLPAARPLLSFHLRAEAGLTILANGLLVGEEEHGDGTKTAHWNLDEPCPSYLTCIAVGELVCWDDGEFEGRPVAAFTTRDFDEGHLRRSFGRTREMLAWMTARLGVDFPYPKYYQFAVAGIGGAMENISLVSWDTIFLLDDALASEWSRGVDSVNVHEMAHSYFGDLVVCRDFSHAWLKESWATYMEQCWFEDALGADEGDYELWMNAQQYFDEADHRYMRPMVTREFASSWEMYDRHLYPGGACRLHTLRHEVGTDTFWAAVHDYIATYAGQVVETADFRRVMERHSGRSLGRFFDQWLHSPGYPHLKVSFSWDAEAKLGTFEVDQAQVQDQAKSSGGGNGSSGEGPEIPVFHLSLDLGWVNDGVVHSRTIDLTRARQVVAIPMDAEPEQVRVDPGAKVLLKLDFNPGDDKLLRQLTGAPDVIGRIRAARELCKTGRRVNVQAVAAAYQTEAFWGVRVEIAAALGAAGTVDAIAALADIVAREQDARALMSVFDAAGRFRDPAIREALELRVEGDLPHRALGAAYEGLGRQRTDAPWALLVAGASAEGLGGFAQGGAYRGLGATRRREALEVLTEHTHVGSSPMLARRFAVDALATLASISERPAREAAVDRMIELLRDPWARVRHAAVIGLQRLGARRALGALEAYARTASAQDRNDVEHTMRSLRASASPGAANPSANLEELREQMRQLVARLEKLEARSGDLPARSGDPE